MKDDQGQVVELDISAAGLIVYRMKERTFTFPWSTISNIEYKKKRFSIKHKLNGEVLPVHFDSQTTALCAVCHDLLAVAVSLFAQLLWTTAVEYHTFFRRKNNVVRFE